MVLDNPYTTLQLRRSVKEALKRVSMPRETYSETILRLCGYAEAHRGEWVASGALPKTEAVRADSRRDPQPEAPKDAGVQVGFVNPDCPPCVDAQKQARDAMNRGDAYLYLLRGVGRAHRNGEHGKGAGP